MYDGSPVATSLMYAVLSHAFRAPDNMDQIIHTIYDECAVYTQTRTKQAINMTSKHDKRSSLTVIPRLATLVVDKVTGYICPT